MTDFRRTGEKGRYSFLDPKCIGRDCWAPGSYQVRGATLSGSRATGEQRLCCMRRAYRGCPDEPEGEKTITIQGIETIMVGKPVYSKKLAAERRKEGWRQA